MQLKKTGLFAPDADTYAALLNLYTFPPFLHVSGTA